LDRKANAKRRGLLKSLVLELLESVSLSSASEFADLTLDIDSVPV